MAKTYPYFSSPGLLDWYFVVSDHNPSTQVFSSARGIFVTAATDTDYATWQSDGSVPNNSGITYVDLQQVIHSLAVDFHRNNVGLGTTTTLTNPVGYQITTPVSSVYRVTGPGSLIMPQANLSNSLPMGVTFEIQVSGGDVDVDGFGSAPAFSDVIRLGYSVAIVNYSTASTEGNTRIQNVKFLNANPTTQRSVLGVAIGTDVQAYDADLTTLAALGADAITPSFEGLQINGAMEVSQEIEGNTVNIPVDASTTPYVVDGTLAAVLLTGAVMVGQQVTPPGSPSFGATFLKAAQLKATTGAAVGANSLAIFQQAIEGYRFSKLAFGGSAAQSVTVGFWVYATIAGTMTVSLRNSAADRGYVSNVVINNATTWEYKAVTIPGDTSGTWLTTNGIGARVTLTFASAGVFNGTNNTWNASNALGTSSTTNFFASNNNLVCITGLTVLPGSLTLTAALSPRLIRPFSTELEICRRYYRKSFPQGTAVAQNAGVAGAITVKNPIALGDPSEYVQFCPTMRASPTIVTYNPSAANANWRDITAAADSTVSVDPASTKSMDGVLIATSGTVATLGDILAIHYTADARL